MSSRERLIDVVTSLVEPILGYKPLGAEVVRLADTGTVEKRLCRLQDSAGIWHERAVVSGSLPDDWAGRLSQLAYSANKTFEMLAKEIASEVTDG